MLLCTYHQHHYHNPGWSITWSRVETGFELNIFKMGFWNHMGHTGNMIIKDFTRQMCPFRKQCIFWWWGWLQFNPCWNLSLLKMCNIYEREWGWICRSILCAVLAIEICVQDSIFKMPSESPVVNTFFRHLVWWSRSAYTIAVVMSDGKPAHCRSWMKVIHNPRSQTKLKHGAYDPINSLVLGDLKDNLKK